MAVDAVVRAGDGSVRDTLSVLEQVLSFSGGDVTGEHVAQVLGHTPFERTAAAVDAAAAGDLAGALALVQQLRRRRLDLRRFAFDLLQHLRDLIVLQVAPDRPDLVDATEDRRVQLGEQAGRVDRARCWSPRSTCWPGRSPRCARARRGCRWSSCSRS